MLTAQLEDLNDAHARSVAFLKELEESLQRGGQESQRPEGTQEEERASDDDETQSPIPAPAPKASTGTSIRKKLASFFSKGKRQEQVSQDVGTGEDDTVMDVQCRIGSFTSLRTPSRVNVGAGLGDSVMLVQPASLAAVASRRSSLSYTSSPQALNRMPSMQGNTQSLPSAGGALVPTPRRTAAERALGPLEINRSLSRSFVERPISRNSMEGTQALPSCPSPIYAASATTPGAFPDIANPPQAPRSAAARRASTGAVTWAALGIPPNTNPASGSPTGSPPIATPHPPARDAPRTPNENALRSRRLSVRQLQLPLDVISSSASFTALPTNGTNPFNTVESPHAISSPHAPIGAAAVPLTGTASPRGRMGRSTSVRPASHASACHVAMPPGITVAAADDGETDDASAYGDGSVYGGSEYCSSPRRLNGALSGSSFRRLEQQQQQQQYLNRQLRSTSVTAPRASSAAMAAGGGGGGPILYGNGSPTVSGSMRRMLLQSDSTRRQLVRQGSVGLGGEGEGMGMGGQEGSPRVLSAGVQEGSVRPLSARVQVGPCGGGIGGEGGAVFRGTVQYV